MTTEDILARLEGVQESGGGWIARCPAHGDDNPSLSIARGEDGRTLMHCHAGCSCEAVVEALGLKMADLMPSNAKPNRTIKGRWGRWVCDYIYTDERGGVLYKSTRYVKDDGKKTFIIKVPDANAKFGWAFGLAKKNVARVPFHLPRVIAAAKAGKAVIIVEGEKDALSVEQVTGCAATCNVAGAMKWGYKFPPNWVEWFAGSNIIIIADNDPKTKRVKKRVKGEDVEVELEHWRGQKHAADVRRRFLDAGFTGKIKLMVMPQVDGQPHVKDFTDWVEARKAAGLAADRAAFIDALKAAAPWPDEWNFDSAALDAACADAEKHGAAADTDVAAAEKSGGDAASSTARTGGRFGRPVPRAPGSDPQEYVVDFEIAGGKFVTIRLAFGETVAEIFGHMIAAVADKCPDGQIPRGVPVRIKAWSAALWLLMRGTFFWHVDYRDFATCMFLDRDKAGCKLMRVISDEFFAFVGAAAKLEDVDPKKGDLAKVLGLVKQIAVSDDYAQGVHPSNSWERKGDAIYISSGDTEMCRIKGGAVEMVQNGTDGVVFLRGKTLAPWSLVDGDGIDPFASAKIFKGASFADANGLMNARLWTLNLFASHRTKPPLLITGGAGSGKTRMAKGIKEILGMRQDGKPDLSVQQIEDGDKGLDAFWATVNDGKLEVFDNFDTKVKWASDTLQTAATDGSTKRRTLYTTFGVSILKANASIILTSNNPIFSTEGNGGLADRLITIPLSLNRSTAEDAELSREIAANRDRYLTWMARTLAKVLVDTSPIEQSVNRRHPDYGEFSVRIGRAIGDEDGAIKALGAAEADKALLPLKNDVVTKEILAILSGLGWRWRGTAGELSDMIIARQGDDEDDKTKVIYSSRRIGKALNKYLRQFSVIFRMAEPRISEGRTVYEFNGTTALGAAVVGLVDYEGDFPKTLGRGGADYLSQNPPSNPPNPPVRARADVSAPLKKEDNNEDLEGFKL
ncbi:MAG: hypothetical protein IJ173_12705 [Kiritimatiellae bacterium]|nr:hypothetical protein [Kiritimatiellia bacterium]MBQ8126713.1 hypothetical protein [Kiritimatiellia bacterium]